MYNKSSNSRSSRPSNFGSKPKSYSSSSESSGPKKFGAKKSSSFKKNSYASNPSKPGYSSFKKSPSFKSGDPSSSFRTRPQSGQNSSYQPQTRTDTPRSNSFRTRPQSSSFNKAGGSSSFKSGGSSSFRSGGSSSFRPSSSYSSRSSRTPSPTFNSGPKRSHGGRSNSSRGGGGRVQKTFNPSVFINKNVEVPVEHVPYKSMRTFADFQLNEKLTEAILKAGLVSPTEIQDQIIPHILANQDVVGLANTGTGKTAAFLIPLIEKALRFPNRQVLILAPTRELAIQIDQELKKLTSTTRIFSVICVGGTSIVPQLKILKNKNQFIIGTPGRVLDLMKRRAMNAENIQAVVLDEADRMLDMGFIHDIRAILKDMPEQRETLFFSATMSPEITKLVDDFLRNPIKISVRKKDVTENIEQDVVLYGDEKNKFKKLTDLLKTDEFSKVLIFGRTKHGVERLSKDLTNAGIEAESIHGNKSHPQRQRALKKFKESLVKVLVATDVAARGIHVDDISHVINFDLPPTYEDYVHRIGRTGRAEKRGKALTFIK